MTLKHARLARANKLPEKIQNELGINQGLVIIETRNPQLREKFIPLRNGSIRDYLLTLGDFTEADIKDTEVGN